MSSKLLKNPKLLRVNLSEREISEEEIPEKLIKKYIGGKGIAGYYLYNELELNTDPLSKENKLVFMTGPVAGYLPSTSRYVVVTKSPLTQGWLDSWSGGKFPAELRFTGYWGIIIEGESESWTVLKIDGDKTTLETPDLEGKDTYQTEEQFPEYKVASIGPAGENLVRFACITNDKGRQAGRGGAGAVMGSKKLKAIAVKTDVSNPTEEMGEEMKKIRQKHIQRTQEQDTLAWARDFGTPCFVETVNEAGILPTHNFQKGQNRNAEKFSQEAVEKVEERRMACYFCPIACSRWSKAKKSPYKGTEVEGPEYETIGLSGSNTEVDDINAIIAYNDICDRCGIDTMTTGDIIAWAMECTERGIHDFGIEFENGKDLVETAKKIAHREGKGDILAEGVKRASEKVGGTEIAPHVKGLEIPSFEPRGGIAQALAYATANRGAEHEESLPIMQEALGELDPMSIKNKAEIVIGDQDEISVVWSLPACDFAEYTSEHAAEIMNALDYDYTEEDIMEIGERIHNLARMFDIREGFDRKDDSLHEKFTKPLENGPLEGNKIDPEKFQKLLTKYYQERGWDENGKPTKETLERLEIYEFTSYKYKEQFN